MNLAKSTVFNIVAFLVTMVAFWYTAKDAVVSMFFTESVALFIAVVHWSRREILPPIAIFVGFKILSLPISLWLFDASTVATYFVSAILLDIVLLLALGRYYRAETLRRLFKVNTQSRLIPQVLAMISVIGAGIFHHVIVLAEVLLYEYDPTIFTGYPFFYTHYEGVKIVIKGLFLIAIWSMCLDSYFVDYDRYKPKKEIQDHN
jgi:hypothetical protein